jgi:hypothetical protein
MVVKEAPEKIRVCAASPLASGRPADSAAARASSTASWETTVGAPELASAPSSPLLAGVELLGPQPTSRAMTMARANKILSSFFIFNPPCKFETSIKTGGPVFIPVQVRAAAGKDSRSVARLEFKNA